MGNLADSTGFWVVAGLIGFGVIAMLLWALLGAKARPQSPALAQDITLYKDQLATLERDKAAGRLEATEADRLRSEIARRLLDADRRAQAGSATTRTGKTSLWIASAAILAAGAGAIAIYTKIGQPGLPDLPLVKRIENANQQMASRPSQADYVATLPPLEPRQPDPEFAQLMEKLRAAVDPATSQDIEGLTLLARNEALLGHFGAAAAAQRQLIASKGATAGSEDHIFLAEILIREAEAYISPEAEAALAAALNIDPQHGAARYYLGLMFAQGGRFDRAFALWQPLLDKAPADAPWAPMLREQIGDVAFLAGVKYEPPSAPKGPSSDDIAAAQSMSAEDRSAMIEGMVDSLSARLAADGGPASEWAQLIRALRVLGRDIEARQIYDEAITRFIDAGDKQLLETAATAEVRP